MADAWRGSGSVLVIDDDPDVMRVAKLLLERLGFKVATALSGRAGVDYFRGHAGDIRCVIIDLTMPDWNGHEVLRRLREISPAAPVILTSGFSEVDALQGVAKDGHAGFLEKPYQLATLVDALRTALGE